MKTDETIWKPPLSKRTPLSTNPPISEQFFHDPLFVEISKTRTPPPLRGSYDNFSDRLKKCCLSLLHNRNNIYLLME